MTSTLARLHSARKERLRRFAARAIPDTVPREPKPECVPPPKEVVLADAAWIERQKKIPMPPTFKQPWFSIEGESEPPEPRKPSIADILVAVAKYYGVNRLEIISSRRTADIVRPRQVAMFLCRELTLRSFPEIGRQIGGRDHTTVLHAVRKIRHLATLSTNYVASDIETIRAWLA